MTPARDVDSAGEEGVPAEGESGPAGTEASAARQPAGSAEAGGEEDQGAEGEQSAAGRPEGIRDSGTGWVGALLIYGGIGLYFLVSWLGVFEDDLQVVARVVPDSIVRIQVGGDDGPPRDSLVMLGPWRVQGRVIFDGTFPAGAAVWAVARSGDGQEYAPGPGRSDSLGAFELGPIPADFGLGGARVTVWARAQIADGDDTAEREGETVVGFAGSPALTDAPAMLWWIVSFFVLSVLIALWPWPDTWVWQTAKYVVIVCLALLLTGSVLYQLGVALVRVEEMTATLPEGQSLSLGFAQIFRGTYVANFPEGWIFSLTEPSVGPDSGVVRGFGAPLWGLLLSVVGAGLFTVSLIVEGAKTNFRTLRSQAAKERVRLIVLHEFYVVFAPVGAIVVYQALVAAGMADEPLTVGLVLMAAGVGLNVILNKALSRFGSLLQ